MPGTIDYEYGVFERRSEGYVIFGRPWETQEEAEGFLKAIDAQDRVLIVRRRVVSGWENLD